MAAKTYKLNISKSDGSFSDSVQFTIPQKDGTYKVEFELSNGNKVNAGNITVSPVEKTYKTEFQLSDGKTIDGGTFTTPITESWRTVWTGSKTVASFLFKSEQAGLRTTTLTNETLAGVDWNKPTRITGVATAAKLFGGSKTEDITALELIDGSSFGLVEYSELYKGSIRLTIIRTASTSEVEVRASCERIATGAGSFSADLLLTKVEQFY